MLLSEEHIKIFDEILCEDTQLCPAKASELLEKLQKLSFVDRSSGGGGSENFLTPKKRKKEEDDATGQQQQEEEEERSAHFQTVEDAFKAAIEEFDEKDDVKRLAFLVDFAEFKAKENESSTEFLDRLKDKSVKGYFNIIAGDREFQELRFDVSDLARITKTVLAKKIRQTFGVGSLVDIINDECGPKPPKDKTYIEGLVKSRSHDDATVKAFPSEPYKAAALVVSGESGSGKSAFVQYKFGDHSKNTNRDKWACIYHSIDDSDLELIKNMLRPSPDCSSTSDSNQQQQRSRASQKLAEVLLKLLDQGHTGGDLYNHLSTLHYNVMAKRNKAAEDTLETILRSRIENGHQRLKSWWNGKESGVNKLVLVIDEAGRDPAFARGLVDSVRKIHCCWQQKKRCSYFKLVLAGSGLEGAIKADSLPIEDGSLYDALASFGTDPMKSNVIALEGPSKEKLKEKLEYWIREDCNLKLEAAEAIVNGVYSRVLATNSRMLFDGVLPMLKNVELTYGLTDDRATELRQRLIELCSTNVVMDYAARKYVDLNALGRLKPGQRRPLLEKCFRFLMGASYATVKGENKFAFDDVEKGLKVSVTDRLLLRQLGLVASNPLETSSALRYLACEGHSVELIQSDGRSFEALVAAHLRRFERVVRGFPTVQTHDLNEAWPPRMSKVCRTRGEVEKHFRQRFAEHVYTDVTTICNQLCKEKEELAIVMQQRIPTAQSADVIVLESVWSESLDSLTLTLDLYQAKHYQDYREKEIPEWARSLGISMPRDSASSLHMSAYYSDLGINFFLECLEKRLVSDHCPTKVEAKIRNRVLVVSATMKQTNWNALNFQVAKASGLKIWTRENLEPTFSAITRGDDGALATENEVEENWGQYHFVDEFFKSRSVAG